MTLMLEILLLCLVADSLRGTAYALTALCLAQRRSNFERGL
jgi:hypothetical protein